MAIIAAVASRVDEFKSRMPFRGRRPFLLELRSSTWFITATVCIGIFTDIFLYAMIVPVFPFSLVERAGVPESDVQHWLSILLSVYGAGLLVGAPLCGFLADRTEFRKGPLLLGLIAVAGATVLLCLANTLPLLIVGRLLQGLAASVIWVVGLALLVDTVGTDDLAVTMGYVGMSYSLATLLAPLLGGIVYAKNGYFAVYAMGFGVIALDIMLRLAMVEKKAAKKWLNDYNDNEGMNEVEPTMELDVGKGDARNPAIPLSVSDPERLGAQQSVGPTSARPKSKVPAILSLWTSKRLLAAFWGNLVLASLITGFDTVLTLFVNRTFGWNSLAAGILFLAPILPSMFSPIIGKYVDRYGGRWFGTIGLLINVPSLVLLRLVDHNTLKQKILLAALLTLVGVGNAIALTALMAEFGKICDAKEKANPGSFGKGGAYAQSYGIFNISWAAGSLMGAFWGGGIYNAAGWNTVTWTWSLLCAVTIVPVFLYTDGWVGNDWSRLSRRKTEGSRT